ncbi:uncharacterized protein LOC122090331 isoform X2 [Macadamia integrifolia]|uniref:uncharacterized protein LOC122090331 isoform X2 n=1 Tax=Macadamia integrifolia TaxID=60698 RepID=UPI001C4F27D3|nr:uncharacterized protein LOC122090331 isoform X2 [Macadamia integrifolia]XP_042516155.1 uncharacterized protein LOC122090331 isoform X2 [Macadamia integrifolia]
MDATKAQSSGDTSKSKLRYPLRSASKPKDDKTSIEEISTDSVPKRGRPASSVSKSVSIQTLSGKDKSAKPPRRLSVPAKSAISPLPRPAGTVTPIYESRPKRSGNGQGKSETPVSEVSKSLNRKKFSVLSSASYWLSQIKLSESAAKHSISLGFFKLALEAGCEPVQRMRDEFKSYVHRHDLDELGEFVKELLESYDNPEHFEQSKVSETCSLVPEEGTQSSGEDAQSSVSSTGARKLRPKSLNPGNVQATKVEEARKDSTPKRTRASRNRVSVNRNSVNLTSVTHVNSGNVQKKNSQKPSRQASNIQKKKIKDQAKKAANEKDVADPLPAEGALKVDKENMQMEEISLTEEVL